MLRRSVVASLLIVVLLVALVPAGAGEICSRCGHRGRCCCVLPRAASAHCGLRSCPTLASKALPAGLRIEKVSPDRAVFLALSPVPAPGVSGRMPTPAVRLPAAGRPAPPTPPPRRLRIV